MTDRQTTYGRAIVYSKREHEFTFTKNLQYMEQTKTAFTLLNVNKQNTTATTTTTILRPLI